MEKYEDLLGSLLKKNFFSTYYDLYHFIYQMAFNVKICKSKGIEGFILNNNTICIDESKNYSFVNLDINLNENKKFKNLMYNPKYLENSFAPEFFTENKYNVYSNIWDIGIAICKIINNGKVPNINYDSKNIEIPQINDEKLINELLRGCLSWFPKERLTSS